MSLTDPKFLDAVIIDYASGRGVLLCRRESDASIQETVAAYKEKPSSDSNWFVVFNLNCLTLKSRMRIQELKSELMAKQKENPLTRKNNRKKHSRSTSQVSRSSRRKLDDLIIGFLVRCVVVDGPKWIAIEVSIDFQAKFKIHQGSCCSSLGASKPANKRTHQKKNKRKGKNKSTLRSGQTAGDRMGRVFTKGDNLHRPWQG